MPWNNPDEMTVAADGEIYIGDVGVTLPTDATSAVGTGLFGLGLTSEDGVTFINTPEITDFRSWQSRQATRRERTGEEVQAAFSLQQWNEESVPFALGGGTITNPSTGVYKYTPPEAGDPVDERAMVIDLVDGDRKMRIVYPRGSVTEAVESQFQAAALAVLPITFKALRPADGSSTYEIYFNDADAFASGS
jgi:hypothetical protein